MFSCPPGGLSLRTGCWNINGFNRKRLGNKFQQSKVLDIINKHDIFGMVQTHADSNSNLQIHDFRHYVKQRDNSKGKRNSGGIAVYIRKTIIERTSFATARNKNILWLKLDKSFFELDKDLYLGIVYISPNTSHQVIDQELLDDIESEIVNFTLRGDVQILQRDFKACTDSMQEFAVHEDDDQFL